MMKKRVAWSDFVKTVTLVASAIIIASELFLLFELLLTFRWTLCIIFLLILLVMCYCIAIAPVYIVAGDTGIELRRVIGKVSIDYSDISEISRYISDGSELRLFGSGGLFGFVGTFHSKTLGRYKSYVGSYKQSFYVTTHSGKTYLFSCKDCDAFIEKVRERMAA